ncbi:WLM domain-domain-containing protein [Leucosporidium creatinivorum]|uniref:WLM domain-domain-containing protein n=1 Tax=Leucosporidium creatinivorum TaxID=106004 RepID=A0A1Y2E5T9_9BASI|nr:WLM domain-domain-containing protein [Leucosporidium creatinivorum]
MSGQGRPGDVLEITVLKKQPRADEALLLLKKIASLVKPIMKKHGWILPTLAEFFPSKPNLLGINVNGGQKICIRLRPAHDPHSFLSLDDSLVGTMLHELTHNVRGPHDDIFYKQLDALWTEYDALRASGYEGEGFLGRGTRVGVGVGHDKGVSLEEARRKALKKFEERERVARLLGKGGKLGGAVPDHRGKRMGDILAEAAERRQRDAKACGHSDDHNHLPPELQAEVDQSAKDSRSVMIDLTQEEEDPYLPAGEASTSTSSGSKAAPKDKKPDLGAIESSPELEILPVVPAKRAAPSSSSQAISSKAPPQPKPRPPTTSVKKPPLAKPPPAPSSAWTCPTCTFDNISPLSLACECCLTERPETVTVALADSSSKARILASTSAAAGGTVEIDEGWMCHQCGLLNEHQFWTCKVCAAVKQSSSRG